VQVDWRAYTWLRVTFRQSETQQYRMTVVAIITITWNVDVIECDKKKVLSSLQWHKAES